MISRVICAISTRTLDASHCDGMDANRKFLDAIETLAQTTSPCAVDEHDHSAADVCAEHHSYWTKDDDVCNTVVDALEKFTKALTV